MKTLLPVIMMMASVVCSAQTPATRTRTTNDNPEVVRKRILGSLPSFVGKTVYGTGVSTLCDSKATLGDMIHKLSPCFPHFPNLEPLTITKVELRPASPTYYQKEDYVMISLTDGAGKEYRTASSFDPKYFSTRRSDLETLVSQSPAALDTTIEGLTPDE